MKKLSIALLASALFWLSPATMAASEVPHNVSIVQLIANPAQFDGQLIRVGGYLVYSPQGDKKQGYLYLTKEDAVAVRSANGLSIEIPDSILEFIEKYEDEDVDVTGKFDAKGRGPWGFNAGTVNTITDIKMATLVHQNQKYTLHAYALPITEVLSTDPGYEAIRKLSLSWLMAVQRKDYKVLAEDFGMDDKQTSQLRDGTAMPRAHWLLFDSQNSVYERFKDKANVAFKLFKHEEAGSSASLYACMFSQAMVSNKSYAATNDLPGIYGSTPALCLDVLNIDKRFIISFLPFMSAEMQ